MFGIKRDATDALFSNFIRKRANYICQRCHKDYGGPCQGIECAHVFSRRNISTRWDPDNALCLCTGCHAYWGEEPLEMYEWYKKKYGEAQFDALLLRKNIPTKVDKKLIRIGLKILMKELEDKEFILGKH